MATDRYRLKYEFWLEPDKPDHVTVADQIERLKNERLFASVIRDGILIISELRQRRVDLLLSLFPWVKEAIQQQVVSEEPVLEGHDLRREIAELNRLIREQNLAYKPATNGQNGPKPMSLIAAIKPSQDNDDDMLVPIKKAKSSGTSAQNFLSSAFNLVQQ